VTTDREAGSKLGGVAFIFTGVLFFFRHLLEVTAGRPPSTGAGILVWVDANKLALSLVSEALFFAALSLVPAVFALYRRLATGERTLASVGCGLIAVVIPLLAMLVVLHGRLVYPIYGLRVRDPELAALVVALFYAGIHVVGLFLAVATFVLSVAMKRAKFGAHVAALGFVSAVCDAIGAYPYSIHPVLLFGCQLVFAAWFVVVGWTLTTSRARGADA